MNQLPISDTVKQDIAEVVDDHIDLIRRQARADHADELQQAGHVSAADYLRRAR